jgi:hypothetical protein
MSPDGECCGNCVFWLRKPGSIDPARLNMTGACRRYPPEPQGWLRRRSPHHLTDSRQWCGERRCEATYRPSIALSMVGEGSIPTALHGRTGSGR